MGSGLGDLYENPVEGPTVVPEASLRTIPEDTGIGLDDEADWPDADESLPFIAESELL